MKNTVTKNILLGVAALSAVAVTAPSQADGQWYIGGAVSQSFIDERGLDEDDTGGKIFGGYNFNDYFAVEGSYYDFGEINDGSNGIELDGLSLSAVGSVPVSARFSLFGKVGVHDWDADTRGVTANQISRESDTDAFYGIGVNYAIHDNLSLRGELERYEVDNLDVDVFSVGISFNF